TCDSIELNTYLKTDGDRSQGILHIVFARRSDGDLTELLPVAQDGEPRCLFGEAHIHGAHIALRRETVAEHPLGQVRPDIDQRRLIQAERHEAVEGNLVRELDEGSLDIIDIGIDIEMLALKVRDHRDSRREREERTIE